MDISATFLAFTYARLRNSRLGGRRVLRPTVLLFPLLMPAHQQGFDGFPILAGAQFLISQAAPDVEGCVEIGVHAVTANLAAKRLLVGPVRTVHVMAHAVLLRGVGALDSDSGHAPLGGIPGDLFGMCPRLEAYR